MSFVSNIVGGVGKFAKVAAPIVAGAIGGPAVGAAVGAGLGLASGGGIKGAVLGGLGGYGAGNLLTSASAFGSSAAAGTGVNLAGNVAGAGVNLAGNIAGVGVQIAPAAFDSALAASTGIWATASSAVNTASNIYKAVSAVNSLTGEKKLVSINSTPAQLGSGWTIPTNQTPVTVDASATTSPIGASTNGGLATNSYMPADPVNATAQSNNSMLLMMILGGAALWFLKVKS